MALKTAVEKMKVSSERKFFDGQDAFIRRTGQGAIHAGTAVWARVEHGYWLADCPCGSGMGAHPEWEHALCYACGAVHEAKFPEEIDEIERVLCLRPRELNRNWTPGETLDMLRAENIGHGCEV